MLHLLKILLLVTQLSLLSVTLAQPISSPSSLVKRASDKVGYLFIHFYDDYKEPGVYTTYPAASRSLVMSPTANDALSYKPLKGGAPLLTSTVGTKGVRDMYIVSKATSRSTTSSPPISTRRPWADSAASSSAEVSSSGTRRDRA